MIAVNIGTGAFNMDKYDVHIQPVISSTVLSPLLIKDQRNPSMQNRQLLIKHQKWTYKCR